MRKSRAASYSKVHSSQGLRRTDGTCASTGRRAASAACAAGSTHSVGRNRLRLSAIASGVAASSTAKSPVDRSSMAMPKVPCAWKIPAR